MHVDSIIEIYAGVSIIEIYTGVSIIEIYADCRGFVIEIYASAWVGVSILER